MNMLEYAKHLGGEVVHEQDEQDHTPVSCCDEMQALLDWSNGVVEMADTAAEFDEMTSDPAHVALRKQIAEHECMPEFARQVAAVNPKLAAKWMASYSGGE